MSQVVDIGERDPIMKSESNAPAAPLPAPAPAPPTSAAMRTAFEMAPTIIRMQETLCRLRPRHIQPEYWLGMPQSGTPQIQVRYIQNVLKPAFPQIRNLKTEHARNNLLSVHLKYEFGKFIHHLEKWPALESAPPGSAAVPQPRSGPPASAAPAMSGKAPMHLSQQQQLLRNFDKVQTELRGYVQSTHVKTYLMSAEGADDKARVAYNLALKFRPDADHSEVHKVMQAIVTLRGKIQRDSGARYDTHGKSIAPGARVKCLTSSTYDAAFTEKEGTVLCKTGCGRMWVVRFDCIGDAPYVSRMIPTRLQVIVPRPEGLPPNWWPEGVAPDGKLLLVPGTIVIIERSGFQSLVQKKGTLVKPAGTGRWDVSVNGKNWNLTDANIRAIAPPPVERPAAEAEPLAEILDRRPSAPPRTEVPDTPSPASAAPAPAPPPPVAEDEFKVGVRVALCDLKNRPELNGTVGVITEVFCAEVVLVEVGKDKIVKVGKHKLRLLHDTDKPAAPTPTPAQASAPKPASSTPREGMRTIPPDHLATAPTTFAPVAAPAKPKPPAAPAKPKPPPPTVAPAKPKQPVVAKASWRALPKSAQSSTVAPTDPKAKPPAAAASPRTAVPPADKLRAEIEEMKKRVEQEQLLAEHNEIKLKLDQLEHARLLKNAEAKQLKRNRERELEELEKLDDDDECVVVDAVEEEESSSEYEEVGEYEEMGDAGDGDVAQASSAPRKKPRREPNPHEPSCTFSNLEYNEINMMKRIGINSTAELKDAICNYSVTKRNITDPQRVKEEGYQSQQHASKLYSLFTLNITTGEWTTGDARACVSFLCNHKNGGQFIGHKIWPEQMASKPNAYLSEEFGYIRRQSQKYMHSVRLFAKVFAALKHQRKQAEGAGSP